MNPRWKLPLLVSVQLIVWNVFVGNNIVVDATQGADLAAIAHRFSPQSTVTKAHPSDGFVSDAELPTGKLITPTAARNSFLMDLLPGGESAVGKYANHAPGLALSPDGRTLAVLTTRAPDPEHSDPKTYYKSDVILYEVNGLELRKFQVLPLLSLSFQGLAWSPTSDALFVSVGLEDSVDEFAQQEGKFILRQEYRLGHLSGVGIKPGSIRDSLWGDLGARPGVGDLAVSPDGARLLVENFENDSVSLIDLRSHVVAAERDLRPGVLDSNLTGQPGGSYPRGVAWISPTQAYVGSARDREIIALRVERSDIRVVQRISTGGQPVAMRSNTSGSRLYVALDNRDQVGVIDTRSNKLIELINVVAPEPVYANKRHLAGVNPNGLTLTPDERFLLVSNGGENAIAVVRLGTAARGLAVGGRAQNDNERVENLATNSSAIVGLVPTGWYPTGLVTSRDGTIWYVLNNQGPVGPNVDWCHEVDPVTKLCVPPKTAIHSGWSAPNGGDVLLPTFQQHDQLPHATLLIIPSPNSVELASLTKQVAHNNLFDRIAKTDDARIFGFLREHIHHVVYVIKENRTYDQFFGDLTVGNGDPRLAVFPRRISPNHHALALQFSTLDNFLVSGFGSWDGWEWETAGRVSDVRERGLGQGVFWGANRNINVGLATSDERHAQLPQSPTDPNILPGARDIAALDGPNEEIGRGYIWDAALRMGLTVRNYGFFEAPSVGPPVVRDPASEKLQVFFPTVPALMPLSDPYYRGWDPALPDFWRFKEWNREFDGFVASERLPNLMLVELGNDHIGAFDRAIDGVNTPEVQVADNDYALGRIVEAIARSPFAKDTLVIATEDDPCDGPDHANAFRSIALFAGPYVRQRVLITKRYTSVNLLKTIEEILGIGPNGLNDAFAEPMSEVFDPNATQWSYKAIVPDILRSTKLPLPPDEHATVSYPRHSAAYWARLMKGQDFSGPDRIEPSSFNHALWHGLKGATTPYPVVHQLRKQVVSDSQ